MGFIVNAESNLILPPIGDKGLHSTFEPCELNKVRISIKYDKKELFVILTKFSQCIVKQDGFEIKSGIYRARLSSNKNFISLNEYNCKYKPNYILSYAYTTKVPNTIFSIGTSDFNINCVDNYQG